MVTRAGGRGVDRFADIAAEIHAGMHRRLVQNGSMRTPNGEDISISPATGLRNGTC